MKRYIDMICARKEIELSAEIRLTEKRLLNRLAVYIPPNEYIELEEEFYRIYSMVEKEAFAYGFMDGIRFLIKSM